MAKKVQTFAWIETLLVGVVIVGAAGLGVYVFSQGDQTASMLESTAQSDMPAGKKPSVKPVADPANPAASWTLYTPPSGEYQISIPDGWSMTRFLKSDDLAQFSTDNMATRPGVAGEVNEVRGGKDGGYGLFLTYGEDAAVLEPRGKQTGTFKTDSGLTVNAYLYQEMSGVDAGFVGGLAKGDREYTYVVNEKGVGLTVSYVVDATKTDNFKTVESFIRSFKPLP